MYNPECQDSFLLYATTLFLEACSQSPSFDHDLFDKSLPNAKFDLNLKINNSFSQNSVVPLFAATQGQIMQQKPEEDVFMRSTQEIKWTPTGVQSSFDARGAYSSDKSSISNVLSIPSTLGGEPGRRSVSSLLSARNYSAKDSISTVDTAHLAKIGEVKRKVAAKALIYQKQAKSRKVEIFRTYRSGELPDIEIKTSDLMQTLKNLACYDSGFASSLLSTVVISLISETRDNSTLDEFVQSLLDLFKEGEFSPLIRGLFVILLKNSRLFSAMSQDGIYSAALKSGNLVLGSLILEEIAVDSHSSHPSGLII